MEYTRRDVTVLRSRMNAFFTQLNDMVTTLGCKECMVLLEDEEHKSLVKVVVGGNRDGKDHFETLSLELNQFDYIQGRLRKLSEDGHMNNLVSEIMIDSGMYHYYHKVEDTDKQ